MFKWASTLDIGTHRIIEQRRTLEFSKQNGVGCKLSNVTASPQRHDRTQRSREQKNRRND